MAKPLRRAVDLATVVAAVALTVMLGRYFSGAMQQDQDVDTVKSSLRRFNQVIAVKSASKDVALTDKGFPATLNVEWFGNDVPHNALVTAERPWVEVATAAEAKLKHPNVRIAADATTAGFWYNPYLGIFRARVPFEISDQKALDLYNQINGSSVASIFGTEALLQGELLMGPPAELAGVGGIPATESELP